LNVKDTTIEIDDIKVWEVVLRVAHE